MPCCSRSGSHDVTLSIGGGGVATKKLSCAHGSSNGIVCINDDPTLSVNVFMVYILYQ